MIEGENPEVKKIATSQGSGTVIFLAPGGREARGSRYWPGKRIHRPLAGWL